MPRTRKAAGPSKQINYNEDSENSEDNSDEGYIPEVLASFVFMKTSRKRTKKPAGRPKKRVLCDCGGCGIGKKNCSSPAPKKRATRSKKPVEATVSTTTALISLDSEEGTKVTESQENSIKKKLDGFFEALGSDDEGKENQAVPVIVPQQKTEEFYTLLSDSDEDLSVKPLSSSDVAPQLDKQTNSDNKLDELLACAEDILNSPDDVIDLSEDHKPPVMSLDELMKKNEEILKGVQEAFDNILPKEPETPLPPVKEALICPVCLDPLGDTMQAVATLCGHIFCEPCLKGAIETSKKCPSCRKKLNKSKYHRLYI